MKRPRQFGYVNLSKDKFNPRFISVDYSKVEGIMDSTDDSISIMSPQFAEGMITFYYHGAFSWGRWWSFLTRMMNRWAAYKDRK
jgi:hypothetical protein